MSTWTHVCGAIRVDGLPGMNGNFTVDKIKEQLGPMCIWDNWDDDTRLPCGSEGSLRYEVIEYDTGLPWVVIVVWGDLRDYSNLDEIQTWWRKTLSNLGMIRDATLFAQTEGGKKIHLTSEEAPHAQ